MNASLKVTIAGSYRKHFDRIVEAKRRFEELGAQVLRPRSETIAASDAELVRLEGDPDDLRAVREAQFEAIRACDLLYVVNPGGYAGASACIEVGYAHRGGTPVITSEPPFETDAKVLVAAVGGPEEAIEWMRRRDASE